MQNFFRFIKESPNAFYAVDNIKNQLNKHGFEQLFMENNWRLEKNHKYYVTINETSCIAFDLSTNNIEEGFKIISSHTDQPSLRIKPCPEITSNEYLKLNVEVYGGPILNTWLDRPLSVAGRVALRGNNPFDYKYKLINFNRPVLTIPNLAIHMNRDINKGIELNKQIDMLPILGQVKEQMENGKYLNKIIAEELNIDIHDILDFDLFVFVYEEPMLLGINKEFISSPRLDDLSMVYTSLESFIHSQSKSGINVFAALDNEEVGSRTIQGADSPLLSYVLERISLSLEKTRDDFLRSLFNSYMISADVAHAVHPNKPEKHDPVNKPTLNKGPVIKLSGNQRYITESINTGVYQQICEKANVPFQKFVNRSDSVGGSTLGPISSAHLPIKIVDMGTPLLAMHSSRELMGKYDYKYLIDSFKVFYNL